MSATRAPGAFLAKRSMSVAKLTVDVQFDELSPPPMAASCGAVRGSQQGSPRGHRPRPTIGRGNRCHAGAVRRHIDGRERTDVCGASKAPATFLVRHSRSSPRTAGSRTNLR